MEKLFFSILFLSLALCSKSILTEGLTFTKTIKVTPELTAKKVGSGSLDVYATPYMVALIENTACDLLAPYLEEGKGTVGTEINVKHLSATPVGMEVTCNIKLEKIDGRKLIFTAEVFDEKGLVGTGIHERFMINNEKFFNKAQQKLQK